LEDADPAAALIIHNQHQIVEVTPAASRLFGWSAAVLRECLLTDLASGRGVSLLLNYACAPTQDKTPVLLMRRGGLKFRATIQLWEALERDGRTLWVSEIRSDDDGLLEDSEEDALLNLS
jgi:PAS domain-containing protein